MLEQYFKYPRVLKRLRSGALGDEMDRISARTAIDHARCLAPDRFSTSCRRPPDPHDPLLAAFLDHLRRVRGLEAKTCEGLLVTARRILAWYDVHVPDQPLAAMTGEHVLALIQHLLSLSTNHCTRTSATSHTRTFLRFLRWSDLKNEDLARFVPRTPCYRLAHLPPPLAWEDVRRMIDEIEAATPSGIRDRALLLMLATTGLRNKELRSLEFRDINWRRAEILLSHSLATELVGQRRPINEVADLLGHRSIDTTAIYVKVALPHLADVALPFPGGVS